MVLSNKKLKQKLRAELSQSLASSVAQSEPKNEDNEAKPRVQSLKVLLDSATQRPRLSKREKRRTNLSEDLGAEKKESESEGKKIKRKREEKDGVLGSNVKETKKSDEKKKNPKKKNKKKKEDKETAGIGNEVKMVLEQNDKIDNGQASGIASTKVYVGGIPYYSTEDDIRSYFEGCGTVTEVDCMTFPESGKFRGIAIISFKTEAAAKRALALDGSDMGGLFLTVQPYKANRANKASDFAPEVVEGYNRIYVGNLSWDITEDKLRNFFSDCKASTIRFGMDKDSGEFRGYAHVEFSDSLSFTMALKLDQKVVCGRPAKISCAVPLRKRVTNNITIDQSSKKTRTTVENIDSVSVLSSAETTNTDTGLSSVSTGKMKRRTCYECGEKGHVSSDCPKSSAPTTMAEIIDPIPVLTSAETTNTDTGLSAVSNGKMKRRTCYECGDKGHVSSDCPKSSAPTTMAEIIDPISVRSSAETTNTDTGLSSVSTGKMRRRTCYECGEKGHISSDCPKRTVDSTKVTVD